MTIKINYGLV